MDSSFVIGGNIADIALDKELFPAPGGPSRITLCIPAAAISIPLLAPS